MSAFPDGRPIPKINIQYRTKIKVHNDGSRKLFNFYLKPWNNFMTVFSRLPKGRPQHLEMPALREVVPIAVKLEDLLQLFHRKNTNIHRLLMDIGPMFDLAPHDLKVYILAVCGVSATEFTNYIEEFHPKYLHSNMS